MDWIVRTLGENWWQGIGVILAVIALIDAIRQNKKKRLSYQVLYSDALVSINCDVKPDLKITYKDRDIEQLNILKIKVINNGGVPIRSSDFEGKLNLNIKNVRSLISYELTDTYPKNIKIFAGIGMGEFSVSPLLLNVGEYFTFQLIFDGPDRDFTLTARIEGISEIRALTGNSFPKATFGVTALMMLLVLITQALLQGLNVAIKLSWYLDYVFTFLITMVGLALAQEFYFRWKNKLR